MTQYLLLDIFSVVSTISSGYELMDSKKFDTVNTLTI